MSLAHSPSHILRDYIASLGIVDIPGGGGVQDWPAYYSMMPEQGDNAVGFYDAAGTRDERLMRGQMNTHPGFSIMVRAEDYNTGWGLGQQIVSALDAVSKTTVTVQGTQYYIQTIYRDRDVLPLGRERDVTTGREKNRELFSISGRLTIEQL